MKISYYPGCSLEATGKAYNDSTQEVCRRLGVELQEPTDWICCGSSPALKMDRLLSVSLASHNLALIDDVGSDRRPRPLPFLLPPPVERPAGSGRRQGPQVPGGGGH